MSDVTVWQQPTVVVVTGLPGTGKSTLAEGIAKAARAPAFSVDWLLGAIAPSGVLSGAARPVVRGVYEGLLSSLLTRQLMLGQSAVLDTIASDDIIEAWSSITYQYDGRLVTVEGVCSDETVHRSRVEGRRRNIPGWHEIDWSHVEFMKKEIEPLTVPRFTVDAIHPAASNLSAVLRHIG
ncbi:AAA family ATPase [Microbacterium sp. KRD172]|uniref:AAA family ATPase n=1 Tax=Microbacterium sp. KRD172 TaxID=2729727 RepID=UPI0019CF9426|nr:AAA family ATPase [Microbacterium sp. KRD172]